MDFDGRSSNPLAPLLQAMFFGVMKSIRKGFWVALDLLLDTDAYDSGHRHNARPTTPQEKRFFVAVSVFSEDIPLLV